MLMGGLTPCHHTLQAAFVQDKIKRLDAILKSIRKQERTEKKRSSDCQRGKAEKWLGSQFISLSVKGNQFLSEIGRQFKHFYSFTHFWKFPVKEWGFFIIIIISAHLTCSPDFQGPPSEDLFKRRASYQDVRHSLLKQHSVDFLRQKAQWN